MPLQKQTISLNFASGLDQKTDGKLTAKLTTADNVVFRKNGTIEKRTGYVAYGTWSFTGNPLKAFPFRDSLVAMTEPTTNSQTSVAIRAGTWTPQELYPIGTLKTKPIFQTPYDMGQLSFAIINGSATQTGMAYVYSTTPSASSTVPDTLSIVDLDGDAAFKPPAGFNNNILKARACALSTTSATVVFGCVLNQQFNILSYTAGSSGATSRFSFNLSATPSGGNNTCDIVAIGSKFYFAFRNTGTTTIVVGSLDPATGTSVTATFTSSITPTLLTIVAPQPSTDRFRVLWANAGTTEAVLAAAYSLTVSQISAPTTLGLGSSVTTVQLEGIENVGNTTFNVYVSSNTLSSTAACTSYLGTVNNSLTMSGVSFEAVGLKMVAKPFMVGSVPHLVCHYATPASQAVYVMRDASSQFDGASISDTSLVPVARALYGVAGGNLSTSREWLPATIAIDSSNFYTVLRRAVSFRGGGSGTITVNNGVELMQFNANTTQCIPYLQFERNLYFGGGFFTEYDGAGTLENGFLGAPTIASVSTTTTGGSIGPTTGSATYSMVAVNEFTDRCGQLHRSQPSQPVSFNASTSTMSVTVRAFDAPGLKNLTRKIHQGSDPNGPAQSRLVVFRTGASGSIYYRDPSQFSNTADVVNSVSITASDSTLSVGDIVYTQGGSLPNWTPDSCVVLFEYAGRVFVDDPSDGSIVRFSKQKVTGEGVAFAQANTIHVPGSGRLSAGTALDSNAIVFRQRATYVFGGNGPDDTGQSGTFSDAQILFAEVGCVDQRSLCRFKDGVVFKSPDKGFYLLTRDLQLQFIGADVESYNNKTVVSSEVVAATDGSGTVEECRFLCSDGTLLTYNYYNGQWTSATLAGCVDAISSGGRYLVVNTSSTASNARAFQQSLTTYTDAFSNTSSTYQMTVETGWYKVADVQGFQRVWRGALIGEAQGAGRVSIEIGYDYETAYNETHTATMSSVTAANYTGGATAAAQFEFGITRQKCQAIRFRIKDYPTDNGVVMKLTNIMLECGIKGGIFRLPGGKAV